MVTEVYSLSPALEMNQLRTRKMFYSIDQFLKLLLQTENGLLVSEMKKMRLRTSFRDKDGVENLSDSEKLARINQHGLQGFYLKISTEKTNPNNILYR